MADILFDISLGASGDMLLGALLDAGLPLEKLKDGLALLNLPGWDIRPERVNRHGVAGTRAGITAEEEPDHRHLGDIERIIGTSGLPRRTADSIISVFRRLAAAEAAVHETTPERVHFHETGALDSIIDISAFCIALELLNANRVFFTEFRFGRGTVQCAHGTLPVPVPAVVELTKGFRAAFTDREGELVTPTGAALLTTLGTEYNGRSFVSKHYGTGFGTRNYPFPSQVRALITDSAGMEEGIVQIECNIDDMNPQIYPHLIDLIFAAGALDAYLTPLVMKKGRPGILLTVIAGRELSDALKKIVFRETTTIGIREFPVRREKLDRKTESVFIGGREVRLKISFMDEGIVNVHPEYEDCRALAVETGRPLEEIMREALGLTGYRTFNSSEEKI